MDNQERQKKIDKLSEIFGFEIPIDFFLSNFFNRPSVNMMAFSKLLSDKDPEYNPKTFVFKGEPNVSMMAYLEKKFGKEVAHEFSQIM
jgi:hypothetical protein